MTCYDVFVRHSAGKVEAQAFAVHGRTHAAAAATASEILAVPVDLVVLEVA